MSSPHLGISPATLDLTELAGDPGTQTKTTVVVDTCVLIADPDALYGFGTDDVVLPLVVIEELDGHKTRPDNVGYAARTALRTIEQLRKNNGGNIRQAADLPNGGTLRIETTGAHLVEAAGALTEVGLDPDKNDNRLLAVAYALANTCEQVHVMSNDAAVRIKAAQLGLSADEYIPHRRNPDTATEVFPTFDVAPTLIEDLYALGDGSGLHLEDIGDTVGEDFLDHFDGENRGAALRFGSSSILVRGVDGALWPIPRGQQAWGLQPRSKEQQFAMSLLLDPSVQVVAIDGAAGTGKTIMAVAAAIQQVMDGRYNAVNIFRPIIPVGKADLGFLPGDVEEKLNPWMAAIEDAISALSGRDETATHNVMEELQARNALTMESVTFLRGRSLPERVIIVDEAQNLEAGVMKTVLTRAGEGTKVVFVGDTSQIDNSYVSEHSNGLTVLIDAFRGERLFGHARLTKGERSEVAELAARRL